MNAPLEVRVDPKAGRTATVVDLTAGLDDGSFVALTPPPIGTFSEGMLTLPRVGGRVLVSFTWSQSAEPNISEACRGVDSYDLTVGPSAPQLRRYLARIGRAQTVWNARRKKYAAILDRYFDQPPPESAGVVALFAYIQAEAEQALRGIPGARRLSSRYARLVSATTPPFGLDTENRDLARSTAPYDAAIMTLFRPLARATTLADLTRAKRAFKHQLGSRTEDLRGPWRDAVAADLQEAGVGVPAWVKQAGRAG